MSTKDSEKIIVKRMVHSKVLPFMSVRVKGSVIKRRVLGSIKERLIVITT